MLQLLDALEVRQSSTGYDFGPPTSGETRLGSPVALPAGFLDDLCAHLQSQEQEENWLILLGILCKFAECIGLMARNTEGPYLSLTLCAMKLVS